MGLFDDMIGNEEEDKNESPSSSLDDIFGEYETDDEPERIDPQPQSTTTPPAPDTPPESDPVLQVKDTVPKPEGAKEAMDFAKDDEVESQFSMLINELGKLQKEPMSFNNIMAQIGLGSAAMYQAEAVDPKQMQGAKFAYEMANNGMEIGHIGSRIMNGNSTDKDQERLKALKARNAEIHKLMDDDTTIAEAFSMFAPYLIQSAVEGGKGAMVGSMVGATLGGILGVGIPTVGEEAPLVMGGFTLGGTIGASFASADAIARVEQGGAYLDMIDQGVDPTVARRTARVIGNINGGLELLQLGMLAKAIPAPLRSKITREATTHFLKSPASVSLLKRMTAMGGEVTAEVAQELVTLYGESIGAAIDKDPSLKGAMKGVTDVDFAEAYATAMETMEITGKGILPLFLPGVGVDVGRIAMGKQANKGADPSTISESDTQQTNDPQDLKSNTNTDDKGESPFKVLTLGNGKLVIQPTNVDEDVEVAVEEQGTPASKEVSKTDKLLGDTDSHISVQDRNLGGQTQTQDEVANAQGDAKQDISNEQRGQMGLELHSSVAEQGIMTDERLQFEIEHAFENNDYFTAQKRAAEQAQNAQTLGSVYTEVLKAQDLKAKGQKKIPNENIQKALSADTDYRSNRAAENLRIAQENVVKQQQDQNQQFMESLEVPENRRAVLFNEVITQKNRGNPEGSKLYDRVLKETAKRENMGDLDYLDGLNVQKLSDLKTDLELYGRDIALGTREEMLLSKTISTLDEQILEKREWDVKKGRDEQGDIRAREQEKARKEAEKAKTKPTTGETKGTKATRRAGTQATGGRAKDVAGKKVAPATKKTQSKLAERVAKQREREAAALKQQEAHKDLDKPVESATAKKQRQMKETKEHDAKIAKQQAENADLTDTEIRKMESEKGQTGTKLILQRLAPKGVRVDALGQKGTTTPETHVQVTITEGKAKGATINVPKKNFSQAIRDAIKSTQELFKMATDHIILDLDVVGDKLAFGELLKGFQRHIKLGKRAWLHKLAEKAGVKYHFLKDAKDIRNTDIYKRQTLEEKGNLEEAIDGLGLFVADRGELHIFVNMASVQYVAGEFKQASLFEVIDHEALHAIVRSAFGKAGTLTRNKIAVELRQLWDTIPESMKVAKYNRKAGGWTIGNLVVKAQPDGKAPYAIVHIETAIRQIDGGIDELLTHGFTNKWFAHYLHSMPSLDTTSQGIKPVLRTMFNKLQELIATKILNQRSKLDDVTNIMNQIISDTKTDGVRYSKAEATPAKGMDRTKMQVELASIHSKTPNAAKSVAVNTQQELPKQYRPIGDGVVESVYDIDTDTVYFVAENIRDEAHLLKKFLHENVGHKGLRKLFGTMPAFKKFLTEARGVLLRAGHVQGLNEITQLYTGEKKLSDLKKPQQLVMVEEFLAFRAEGLDLKSKRGLVQKFRDLINKWLPTRFLDKKNPQAGSVLTDEDLYTVLEAAKHGITGKQPGIKKTIDTALAARQPRVVSSIHTDVKFQRTVKGYAKLAIEVLKKFPEARDWYPAHALTTDKIFGKDGILFNILLAITSPQADVITNVGHAVDTLLYKLNLKSRPGGLFHPQVKERVDLWKDEKSMLENMGDLFKINEFARGLMGDHNATVLDIWMHRLFFGDEHKAPGAETFLTRENQAGRQLLFEISKEVEHQTGKRISPRDTQAVLWTWIKAKSEGTKFDEVPNFEVGFHTPRVKYEGRTALEELYHYLPKEEVEKGLLSTALGIGDLQPTPMSRMEKSRLLQITRDSAGAEGKFKEVKRPKQKFNKKGLAEFDRKIQLYLDGIFQSSNPMFVTRLPKFLVKKRIKEGRYKVLMNEQGTAGLTVDTATGELAFGYSNSKIPGIGVDMIIAGIKEGGTEFQYFDGYLDGFYKNTFGVQEVERYPWDPSQAPTGWDTATQGTPDYVISRLPEYVVDSYRDKNGKLTEATIRKNLGGSELDLEPRTGHRYSLAKIEYSDSAAHDEAGLTGPDGQPNFLNVLFEWKDQADLNIQREINRLEQEFLEMFGGRKLGSKLVPGSMNKLSNNARTRLLQKAMNLYIDSGEKTPHLKFVRKYMHELNAKKKLTNVERDRLDIINRMLEMTEDEKAWADNNIRPWYDEMYEFAKERGILDTYVESYVSRAWKVPKGHDVVGAANTEQTAGSFSNFKITTPHAKQRQFKSIVDGWREGTDWTLKNDALLTNLHTYMDQINEVATNLRFINYMKEMVDENGDGLIREDLTDQKAREIGYVQLSAKGFAAPMKKIYARKDIAGPINKVTMSGTSDMWNVPGLLALQKINAMVKGSILSLSMFHHLAGVRSWEFGVKKGLKLNAVKAYKDGLNKIEQMTETDPGGYKLGPTADFLIKHGLTIGKIQDWDQSVLAGEKSLIESILSGRKSGVSRSLLNLKRTARHGREMWTRSLFGRLFAGLKVEAASLELAHNIKVAERQKGEALTSAELAEIGRKTSRIINADFGGLHLRRMGRNMDLQKFAQLLLLAPDWTESNFRTVTGMMGMNKWINKMISDFPAPAGMQKAYAKFWFGVGVKLMAGYALAVAATMAVGDEEDREKYAELLKHSFTSWEGFKKAKWAGIPLDPWLNRIPGHEKDTEWTGFRLGGHFFDILKVMEPDKLIKHKVSPMIRTLETLATGTDWKGAPIVGIDEMLKTGKIVSDNPFERERNFFNRLIPTAAYEVRAAMPIFAQEGLRQLQGEAYLSEFGRAAGVDIRPMRIPNLELDEYTEIKAEINAIERDIKEAKTAKNKEAEKIAKQKRKDFRFDYNKTKSRLGYAKKRISKINSKIKVLTIKQKLGKELNAEETKRLKNLEDQKQAVIEKFLEVVKRSKR